ncbi:hypothetical protein THIAE_02870 [Thiomicrospira aerophila AL3]|uniref:Uncharacterized protein n=1 Tax=Thiomicrospira aerophila AL3 TaxID=717772 RepID=W0DQG6_9GAMM|nr:hypothetical protein [Thiomicrospira aerophila]AHF00855.1 hypothetical protein THIAE_02870 [Thiomicrospira aerophila AL3]
MRPHFKPYEIDQYVDDELDINERLAFEKNLQNDANAKEQVCVKRHIKAQISQHYKKISPLNSHTTQTVHLTHSKPNIIPSWRYIAAGLAGLLLGMMLNFSYPDQNHNTPIAQPSNKFVIHLDNNQQDKMVASLQKASQLLNQQPNTQVQIITNHEGIELFNAQNAMADEIITLVEQHQNLELIACRRTLERIGQEGKTFNLLPAVRVDEPAVDEVVKRLKSGWTFIKI